MNQVHQDLLGQEEKEGHLDQQEMQDLSDLLDLLVGEDQQDLQVNVARQVLQVKQEALDNQEDLGKEENLAVLGPQAL